MTEMHSLRLELEDLYAEYASCIDDGPLERWPDFFVDPCVYKIIPRENYDRGLPLTLMSCESVGMLRDRVEALKRSSVFVPRALRHMVTSIRIFSALADCVEACANYLVLETLLEEPTRILSSGRYLDKLTRVDGRFRFRERLCVADSVLVPGSLVYPV